MRRRPAGDCGGDGCCSSGRRDALAHTTVRGYAPGFLFNRIQFHTQKSPEPVLLVVRKTGHPLLEMRIRECAQLVDGGVRVFSEFLDGGRDDL